MTTLLQRNAEHEPSDLPVEAVSTAFAATLEQAEVNAWVDLYAAAPSDFAERFGLSLVRKGDVVATFCTGMPFIHFNSVMNLGMAGTAAETVLDELLAAYREAGIKRPWVYLNPHCQPAGLAGWLESRGLRRQSGWDRIWRDARAASTTATRPSGDLSVERVSEATAPEWAAFIDGMYRMPTSPWLIALVGRTGWSHYALRRRGGIVAVRSMFMDPDGMVWMGIDAPVPGIMAPSFDLDAVICETMVRDGLEAGARCFVADIEAPLADGNGPAYRNFARLGFRRPYFRDNYGL